MRNEIIGKHINHWAEETGGDSQIYSAAIQPSFIKTVRGDLPKGTIQIKKHVPQGTSAGMPTDVWCVAVTAACMENVFLCVCVCVCVCVGGGGSNSVSGGMRAKN